MRADGPNIGRPPARLAGELDRRAALQARTDPPRRLRPTLVTEFRSSTIAAADEPERSTIDSVVKLSSPRGPAAVLRDGCVLVETKTGDGDGKLDRLVVAAGCEPISLSKYRLGIGLLLAGEADRGHSQRFERLFEWE